MLKRTAIYTISSFLLLPLPVHAQMLQQYEDMWFSGGAVCRDGSVSADLSFKISARLRPLELGKGWTEYVGYTQTTVWDAFQESGPFHDNLYNPGIYFTKDLSRSTLTLGIEHLSNGRPYYGNALAKKGYDDLSRGMNYALAKLSFGISEQLDLSILAKAGVGCGVGDFDRHASLFTQDLFVNYLGYVTFSGKYNSKGICSTFSFTPIWNKSIANVTLDFSWTFNDNFPALFIQAHYGFDQSLCDCVPDKTPPASVRFGIVLRNN